MYVKVIAAQKFHFLVVLPANCVHSPALSSAAIVSSKIFSGIKHQSPSNDLINWGVRNKLEIHSNSEKLKINKNLHLKMSNICNIPPIDDGQLCRVEIEFQWSEMVKVPIPMPYTDYTFDNETFEPRKCKLSAFVQGDIDRVVEGKTVFLTVHDIGKNYLSFVRFVNSTPMAAIKKRGVFVHFCVPGQEPDAKDFDEDFPSTGILADALAALLESLKLKRCVVIGEGAGADIACRFAMNHPKIVSGLLLIHCTSTTHGIVENIREIFTNLVLEDGDMTNSAWNYLLTHRFGNHKMDEHQTQFMERINKEWRLNPKNLSRYIYSFSNRCDFTGELKEKDGLAKVDTMLVTGGKSAHNENVRHMFYNMDKSKTGMLVAEDCADVLEEAPDYLVSALMLLCHRKKLREDVQYCSGKADGNIQPESGSFANSQHDGRAGH